MKEIILKVPGLPVGFVGMSFDYQDVFVGTDPILRKILASRKQLWEQKFGDSKGLDEYDAQAKQVCVIDSSENIVGACRLVFGDRGGDLPGQFDLEEKCIEISRCDTKGEGLLLLILVIWEIARREGFSSMLASFRVGFIAHLKEFGIPIEEIGEPVFHGKKKFLRVRITEPDMNFFLSRMKGIAQAA